MPAPSKFHDVAIAIHEALEDLQATYAFLGGYAIAAMGAPRDECRGIDCVVDCDKEWLVSHLRGYSQFRYMANAGTDKARFLYGPEDLMLVFFLSMSCMSSIDRVCCLGRYADLIGQCP